MRRLWALYFKEWNVRHVKYMQWREGSRLAKNMRIDAAVQLLRCTQDLLWDEIQRRGFAESTQVRTAEPLLASQDENDCCIYLLEEILVARSGYTSINTNLVIDFDANWLGQVLVRLREFDAQLFTTDYQPR